MLRSTNARRMSGACGRKSARRSPARRPSKCIDRSAAKRWPGSPPICWSHRIRSPARTDGRSSSTSGIPISSGISTGGRAARRRRYSRAVQAKDLGRRGERRAAWFYRLRGYWIVARNERLRRGEIDLVVRRGKVLVFVEVKTRQSLTAGEGYEAVDRA